LYRISRPWRRPLPRVSIYTEIGIEEGRKIVNVQDDAEKWEIEKKGANNLEKTTRPLDQLNSPCN